MEVGSWYSCLKKVEEISQPPKLNGVKEISSLGHIK